MKICLINPPLVLPENMENPHHVFQPLGLAYIAAVLEKEHNVIVIEAIVEGWRNPKRLNDKNILGLTFDEIREKIKFIQPDIVGITVPFSMNAESAFLTAATAKAVNENITTVLGGPHPSIRPLESLLHPHVDFVVVGEGEVTVRELFKNIENGRDKELKNIRGIGYKQNGKPTVTEPRPLIKDLDSLPFPARHLLPMSEYFASSESMRVSRKLYNFNNRWASIITSRGCPFNCSFCSIKLTMGRGFRARSPENIIQEIDKLVHNFGIRHFNFEDDNFTLNKHRARAICKFIIERNYNITWSAPNGIRADMIDEDMVLKMKASGCKRVFVAPESGVQRVVTDVIGKNLDLKKVEEAVGLFKKHKITVDGSFVIGSIGETKSDICGTIKYALKLKKLGMEMAGFHIATPLYGTRLYEEAIQKGYLKKGLDNGSLSPRTPLIETPEWTASELLELLRIANWFVNYSVKKKITALLKNIWEITGYKKYARKIFKIFFGKTLTFRRIYAKRITGQH